MKGGESSMEQTEILLAIQQQLTMLQSTIDTLREQSRQKDEEIERLRQIILNLQRAQFGQRSEKRTYVLDDGNQQLSMFDTPKKSEEMQSEKFLAKREMLAQIIKSIFWSLASRIIRLNASRFRSEVPDFPSSL